MADDKGGSSGGGWEPFEIIVIIILLIALLNRFQGFSTKTNTAPYSATTPKVTVVKDDPTKANCGLTITRPKSSEVITTAVTLVGKTKGCNWKPNGATALMAQIVDKLGVPMSDYVSVPIVTTDTATNTVSFNTTILINAVPTKGTGYLILLPALQSQAASSSVRIPIVFK